MRTHALAAGLAVMVVALSAEPARARDGGLYLEVAPSWGFYLTKDVLVDDAAGSGDHGSDDYEYATATFVPALKLGINLFGWAGVEGHITGHFWDAYGDPGGAAYGGGVLRLTPLEVLTYILPDTVQIPSVIPAGPVTWKNRPFDLGVSFGGGYTIAGEDFAYQGGYFQWGFDIKFFITPNLALGLDFPFRNLFYQPFRYSDFSSKVGFCTDHGNAYGYSGDHKVNVNPNPDRNVYRPVEVKAADIDSKCKDPAPEAFFFAPAVTLAGVIDFGI
jgi:hypothetical protein